MSADFPDIGKSCGEFPEAWKFSPGFFQGLEKRGAVSILRALDDERSTACEA
jgi:hypothetical protein